MNLDSLIKFDDYPEMVDSEYKNFHVWTSIRVKILKSYFNKKNNLVKPINERPSFFKLFKCGIVSVFRFPFFIRNKDILYFSSSVVNVKHGDGYENRLYDTYFQLYENNSLLLESAYNYEYRTPRKCKVYSSDFFLFLIILFSYVFYLNKKDLKILKKKFDRIKSSLNDGILEPQSWRMLEARMIKSYKRFVLGNILYGKMIKKINPKVVFVEDASYGEDTSMSLAFLCNKAGIQFAEFQHGLVSKDHYAYNYGKKYSASINAKKNLPKYFLTFGKYWSDRIEIPGKKINIGFPYLNRVSSQRNLDLVKKTILIVSDGDKPHLFFRIVETLAKSPLFYDYDLVLKLHPIEVVSLDKNYGGLKKYANVKIKTYTPVYDFLLIATAVVGCASTVMHEAICFGLKPFVFLNKISKIRADLPCFNFFSSVDELLDILLKSDSIIDEEIRKYIWEESPEENYIKFIQSLIY